MSFGLSAAAIGGIAAGVGAVGGAAISANAARSAANTQAGAARDASAVQREMFDISTAQQQPFIQSGYGANDTLSRLLGINPQQRVVPGTPGSTWNETNGRLIGDQFLPPDVETIDRGNGYFDVMQNGTRLGVLSPGGANGRFHQEGPIAGPQPAGGGAVGEQGQYGGDSTGLPTGYLTQTFGPQQFMQGMDPSYRWRFQQGLQGVQNSAAAGSGSLSGAALKALTDYGQQAASQEFGSAFDRFQTQQGNIFERLSSLAQTGQNAAAGVGVNAINTGASIGGNIVGAGNAGAAGQVGAANAYSGALGSLGGLAYLYGNKP